MGSDGMGIDRKSHSEEHHIELRSYFGDKLYHTLMATDVCASVIGKARIERFRVLGGAYKSIVIHSISKGISCTHPRHLPLHEKRKE